MSRLPDPGQEIERQTIGIVQPITEPGDRPDTDPRIRQKKPRGTIDLLSSDGSHRAGDAGAGCGLDCDRTYRPGDAAALHRWRNKCDAVPDEEIRHGTADD